MLLPVARPPLRRMTWPQWWPVLLLAAVFGCMNLSLYTAIDRIGLGLAVTLEFLGPLAVALAGSRSRRDLLIAAAAAAGVYVLVLPGPSSDYLGLGRGRCSAAACWAAYILLNRVAGARLPGLQAPAVATGLCALAYLPVLVLVAAGGRLTAAAVGYAVAAGVLASVVPYAADLIALRFVPARFFGVFMSVHPVLAALVGTVLLGQFLRAARVGRHRRGGAGRTRRRWRYRCSTRIPARKSARASWASRGRTAATYWSGRTTTMQPASRSMPRRSKTSPGRGSGQNTFSWSTSPNLPFRGSSTGGSSVDRQLPVALLEDGADVDDRVRVGAGRRVPHDRGLLRRQELAQLPRPRRRGRRVGPVGEDVEAPGAVGPGGVAELHRLGVGQPDDRGGVEAHPDREALGEVLELRPAR